MMSNEHQPKSTCSNNIVYLRRHFHQSVPNIADLDVCIVFCSMRVGNLVVVNVSFSFLITQVLFSNQLSHVRI